jgi:multimeric flavodoxin WrbA
MTDRPHALLLIGSAKKPRSTSESLGSYLMTRLGERGCDTESLSVHRSHRSRDGLEALLDAVDRCDLLVLAFPLYVDSLPALLTRTLEMIASRRGGRQHDRRQRLVAIVNNGFPEAEQNEVALRICRRFASETGFEWAGGLALGGGEAINGRPLTHVKGMARNVISSLDLAAGALAAGEPVPERAVRLMAKRIIWSRIYTWLGTRGWKRRAATHGVAGLLDGRPYQP